MKLNKLIIPALLLILAFGSEYIPELFKNIDYGKVTDNAGYTYETTYRDAVWYFTYSLLLLTSMVSVFLLIKPGNITGRLLMVAPISYFSIELIEKVCFLAKINENRLHFNHGSVWQILIALSLVSYAIYGYTKFKS